ncbi:hypothetical protein DM02DRAFT_657782 [Periconia macrospinosa]|uniref:Uncharacterized protein n=1 Tax=Periconia macrospinosa TaxID=97972 RepID=A0A2V1DIE0_9PLEO|nr:hypothetical protein DM02DRAFT_657782 [Periconia macrospinosa]
MDLIQAAWISATRNPSVRPPRPQSAPPRHVYDTASPFTAESAEIITTSERVAEPSQRPATDQQEFLSWDYVKRLHAVARTIVFAEMNDSEYVRHVIWELSVDLDSRVFAVSLMHVLQPIYATKTLLWNRSLMGSWSWKIAHSATLNLIMAGIDRECANDVAVLGILACFVPTVIEPLGFSQHGITKGSWADSWYRKQKYSPHRKRYTTTEYIIKMLYVLGMYQFWEKESLDEIFPEGLPITELTWELLSG